MIIIVYGVLIAVAIVCAAITGLGQHWDGP